MSKVLDFNKFDLDDKINMNDIDDIKSDPQGFAKNITIKDGINFLKMANYYYYHTDKPIISDSVYDKIEDVLKERSPKNKFWSEIREGVVDEKDTSSNISIQKEKVKLPYWMGSMDKIKPGKEQIEKWSVKYPGPYVLSEKLDGMSCLLVYTPETQTTKLYSRGDGSVGQDISNLLKYVKTPKLNPKKFDDDQFTEISNNDTSLAVRGELIISRSMFDKKYKDIKNDPRSMVAGLMNAKYADTNEICDLDLVIYEIIEPGNLKASLQFDLIRKMGFKIPRNEVLKVKKLDEEILVQLLIEWKTESNYEIDGLIITQDKGQDRNTDGNPDYSRAFKMDLDEQRGLGEVEEILWDISRHGKIIPRIKIKPLKIGGVVIQKATAFNAKFIKDNKLGPGAVVNIIRSGDVIPKIDSVVKEAPDGASMPDMKYKWHDGGYDIYIDEDEETESKSDEIEIKKITYFMTTLEAEGISASTIKRYYDAGFTTIKSILDMTMDDLLKLPSTKDKLATKQLLVLENIKTKEHPLELLMTASGNFGLGIGFKKIKLVIDTYPDIMTKKVGKTEIKQIDGFEDKTTTIFLDGLEKFKKWLKEHKLYYDDPVKKVIQVKEFGKLDAMIITMTGFRDKDLKTKIEELGGEVSDNLTSKTNILLAKEPSESGAKMDKARKLNIPIMSVDEFKTKYF